MLALALALGALAAVTPDAAAADTGWTTGPPPPGAVDAMIGAGAAGAVGAATVVVIWNGGDESLAVTLLPGVVVASTLGAGVGEFQGDGTFLTASVGALLASVGGGVAGFILGIFVAAAELAPVTAQNPDADVTADDIDLRGIFAITAAGAAAGGVMGAWMGAASNEE